MHRMQHTALYSGTDVALVTQREAVPKCREDRWARADAPRPSFVLITTTPITLTFFHPTQHNRAIETSRTTA